MRLSEEELKKKYAASWNDKKGNIVSVLYGDIPHTVWDAETFKRLTWDTLNRYIYANVGEFDEYYTLLGGSRIKKDGTVLCCDINVKYRGLTWSITLNELYGYHRLSILYLPYGDGIIQGWSTKDNSIAKILSPTGKYKNIEHDILSILDDARVEEYGYGIKQALKRCRELYLSDTTNYFDERR